MTVKLITYDLNQPGQKHEKVVAKIKEYGNWARLSESSYAVETEDAPQVIYNNFKPLLDQNDTLYVVGLHKPHFGQGSQEVNQWLDGALGYC